MLDSCWCGIGQLACVSADQVLRLPPWPPLPPARPHRSLRLGGPRHPTRAHASAAPSVDDTAIRARQVVRVNDLMEDEENHVLTLADVPGMEGVQDKLVSLSYQSSRRVLAAGTRDGRLCFWKHLGGAAKGLPEKGWEALPVVNLGEGEVTRGSMAWSKSQSLLAVCGSESLHMLPETVLRREMCGDWALVQLDAHNLVLEHLKGARVGARPRPCPPTAQAHPPPPPAGLSRRTQSRAPTAVASLLR